METGNGTALKPGKRSLSRRKERSESNHVPEGNGEGFSGRRQLSLASIGGQVRAWWSKRTQTAVSPTMSPQGLSTVRTDLRSWSTAIPQGLTTVERAHYETLIKVVKDRAAKGVKTPRVVVITDLAKDYDDLAAMIVLKELHRLGVIELLGFVANLMPAVRRARFGRGALDLLDLPLVPIAVGTSGFPDSANKKHQPMDYEFDCDFMDERPVEEGSGKKLLEKLCLQAVETNRKLTLVLISSLEDIFKFSEEYPELLRNAVSNVVLQGGYSVSPEGNLDPDEAAANNRYDRNAAKKFHTFIQESNIPSAVYTKVAAFATPLTTELFNELAETKHPLGVHLRKVQVSQDLTFYSYTTKPPAERFAPFMDQPWFLKNKTSWFDREHPPGTPYPEGDEVVPYLDKVVVYDALAALGSAGDDALDELKVLTSGKEEPKSIHRVVGFAGPPEDLGIHPEQMATVLSALMKGSLLTSKWVRTVK
jgi:hypothetical protein